MDQNLMKQIYNLEFWVGQEISVRIPLLDPERTLLAKLCGVEAGGIWLECEQITVSFCGGPRGVDDTAQVTAFFPYSQILFLAVLDHKSLKRAQVLAFGQRETPTPDTTPA